MLLKRWKKVPENGRNDEHKTMDTKKLKKGTFKPKKPQKTKTGQS